jgi:molybdate transport system substrate-binding protein
VVLAVALLGAACGDDGTEAGAGEPRPSTTGTALSGSLTVFAAASLTEGFTELGKAFEADHRGVNVKFTFAASSALAQQINDGADADVFASADEANMAKVTDAANASDPKTFARNRLSIIVEEDNPKAIRGLADLAEPGIVLVLCAPEVPCGRFAAAALQNAGVAAMPASLEENVKAVVSKVTLGEADAGIVYVTDVLAARDDADGVDIDIADDPDLEAVYLMAETTTAKRRAAARAWIDFALSDAGQRTLATFGFVVP